MNSYFVWVMRGIWLIGLGISSYWLGGTHVWLLSQTIGPSFFMSVCGLLVGIVASFLLSLLLGGIWICGDQWLCARASRTREINLVLMLIGIASLTVGCVSTNPAPLPHVVEVPAIMATPAAVEPPPVIHAPPPLISPQEAMHALSHAYQQAMIRPRAGDFRGIVAHLPDYPNALFALNLRYRQPLTILLPHGELAEPLILDDWWHVTNTVSGEGASRRGVIVIQALNDQPQTSYTSIVSNKVVRFLELNSVAKGRSLRAVTWERLEPPKPPVVAWPPGIYHTDYVIEPKDGGPAWKPIQVWTLPDVQKTVILWPEAKFQRKAPVIYVLGPDGKQRQVVNRRSPGRYTEIDELFDAAELRVGHDPKNQEVVYIRAPATKTIRCPGDESCPIPPGQRVR